MQLLIPPHSWTPWPCPRACGTIRAERQRGFHQQGMFPRGEREPSGAVPSPTCRQQYAFMSFLSGVCRFILNCTTEPSWPATFRSMCSFSVSTPSWTENSGMRRAQGPAGRAPGPVRAGHHPPRPAGPRPPPLLFPRPGHPGGFVPEARRGGRSSLPPSRPPPIPAPPAGSSRLRLTRAFSSDMAGGAGGSRSGRGQRPGGVAGPRAGASPLSRTGVLCSGAGTGLRGARETA